jgi:HAD superfamily hydrolase (TIGR01490 family)
MENGKVAAFFDFDNTLLAGDSARIGFKYLWERREVGLWFLARLVARNFFYKRNLYSPERISRFALTFYAGRDISGYKAGAREYYGTVLKPHIAPKVRERLNDHKRAGHVTALVTASVRYMLEPVAADLGIDHLLCTDLEIGPDGRPTGRPIEPICVCAGKVAHAKRLAKEQGIDLQKSYAYSDHHSDLPLLELAGHPVCVEPTTPLRRIASARGWEVIGLR